MDVFTNKKLNTFYFLRYISEFTKELKKTFTDFNDIIHEFRKELGKYKDELKNVKTIEDIENTKFHQYIKDFMNNISPNQIIYIKGNDLSFLENEKNIYFIYKLDVDFYELWNLENISENQKDVIIKYLNILLSYGVNVLENNQEDPSDNYDQAQNTMKEMFGNNKVISSMVDDIVGSMKSELGDQDIENLDEKDLMSTLLGNNGDKLFKIINKTQNNVKKKMRSGELSKEDMMNSSEEMMKNMMNKIGGDNPEMKDMMDGLESGKMPNIPGMPDLGNIMKMAETMSSSISTNDGQPDLEGVMKMMGSMTGSTNDEGQPDLEGLMKMASNLGENQNENNTENKNEKERVFYV